MIITKGSRGSGESGVFEQRRESSPVVQSCKRVDMSEETTAANAKKNKKRRQTGNLEKKNTINTRAETQESMLESNSHHCNQLPKLCYDVLMLELCFDVTCFEVLPLLHLSEMIFFLKF